MLPIELCSAHLGAHKAQLSRAIQCCLPVTISISLYATTQEGQREGSTSTKAYTNCSFGKSPTSKLSVLPCQKTLELKYGAITQGDDRSASRTELRALQTPQTSSTRDKPRRSLRIAQRKEPAVAHITATTGARRSTRLSRNAIQPSPPSPPLSRTRSGPKTRPKSGTKRSTEPRPHSGSPGTIQGGEKQVSRTRQTSRKTSKPLSRDPTAQAVRLDLLFTPNHACLIRIESSSLILVQEATAPKPPTSGRSHC